MENIVVLHIGYADGDKTAGVSVSIPEYLHFQSFNCKCALFNLANCQYSEFTCFLYKDYKEISELPGKFNIPSIVVFHELYRVPFLRLYKECNKKNIPYIIIPHGGLTKKAQKIKKLKKLVGNAVFFNNYIRKSACIHFLSEQERSNSIWNEHKSFVLGNGIEIPDINIEDLQKGNSFELLFIGRYDIYFKGLDILFEAISKIKLFMRENNVILHLYGKGSEKDENYLREYIKKNDLFDIIKLEGSVFSKEKVSRYCKANIFIQTSRSEGQPMGILEAMSCYLPLIVTPGTTMGDVVRTQKLGYITELNADSIGKTIIEAYKNRDNLEAFAVNARNFVSSNFDGNNVAKKAIEMYKRVIERDI